MRAQLSLHRVEGEDRLQLFRTAVTALVSESRVATEDNIEQLKMFGKFLVSLHATATFTLAIPGVRIAESKGAIIASPHTVITDHHLGHRVPLSSMCMTQILETEQQGSKTIMSTKARLKRFMRRIIHRAQLAAEEANATAVEREQLATEEANVTTAESNHSAFEATATDQLIAEAKAIIALAEKSIAEAEGVADDVAIVDASDHTKKAMDSAVSQAATAPTNQPPPSIGAKEELDTSEFQTTTATTAAPTADHARQEHEASATTTMNPEEHAASTAAKMSSGEIASRIEFLRERRAQLEKFLEEEKSSEEDSAVVYVQSVEASQVQGGVRPARHVRIHLSDDAQFGQRCTTTLPGGWRVDIVATGDAEPGDKIEMVMAVQPVDEDEDDEEPSRNMCTRCVRIRLPDGVTPGQKCAATLPGDWQVQFEAPADSTPGMLLDFSMAVQPVGVE